LCFSSGNFKLVVQ